LIVEEFRADGQPHLDFAVYLATLICETCWRFKEHSMKRIPAVMFAIGAILFTRLVFAADAPPQSVTLLAAASTQNAVKEIAAKFTKETGIDVKISAAGSNTLATQIINGAPADLFLSADQLWADTLEKKGLVAAMRPLLSNNLVLIVPKGNPAAVTSPSDLLGPKVTHVAIAGEKVPCGIYAKQALSALSDYDPLDKAGKIARGQDVRGTLAYVERGEADAGIVYSTDAAISKDVIAVYTFDPKTFDKVVYPLVLLKNAPTPAAAKQLYDYLGGDEAHAIFDKYKFRFVQ
jgi:molybdate transport system substrate-binding protein